MHWRAAALAVVYFLVLTASVNAFTVPSPLFGKELINIPEAGTLCLIVSICRIH